MGEGMIDTERVSGKIIGFLKNHPGVISGNSYKAVVAICGEKPASYASVAKSLKLSRQGVHQAFWSGIRKIEEVSGISGLFLEAEADMARRRSEVSKGRIELRVEQMGEILKQHKLQILEWQRQEREVLLHIQCLECGEDRWVSAEPFGKKSSRYECNGCLAKDILGKRFGRLVVNSLEATSGRAGKTFAVCTCDCGQSVRTRLSWVLNGLSSSCGCGRKGKRGRRPQGPTLLGKQFGLLTVLAVVHPVGDPGAKKGQSARVACRCQCGNMTEVLVSNMKKGSTKSCGCLRKQEAFRKAS